MFRCADEGFWSLTKTTTKSSNKTVLVVSVALGKISRDSAE